MRSQLFGTPTNRVKVLEDLIQQYSQAYYDGSPLVSDQAFDQLIAELRGLDSLHPLLRTTSTGYKNPFTHLQKVKHPFHVGSLDKLKWEEIQAGRRWPVDVKIVASVKVDGGSGTAHYDENGWLIRVLSRGDGEEGLDITQNVVNIPRRVPATGRKEVIRGELVITWEDFEGMDKSHPRNAACGLSQSVHNDPEDLAKVRFVAYSIYDFEGTKLEMLQTLETAKFEVVPFTVFEGFNDFVKAVREGAYKLSHENVLKDGKHLPCDGTVLTENDTPENQTAVKFEEETAITEITGFEWNMSRTGRCVPTILLKTVNLAGANISRASGNNVAWCHEMGAYTGAQVRIARANEIIPQVLEVLDKSRQTLVRPPEVCPVCGEKLQMRGRDLICDNDACNSKIFTVFDRILMVNPVDGIGPTTLEKFYQHYNVKTLENLRGVIYSADLSRMPFGESTNEKLRQLVLNIRNYTPTVGAYFWMANIPRVGDGSQEKFDREITPDEFVKVLYGPHSGGINRPERWNEITGDFMGQTGKQILDRYHTRLQDLYEFFGGRIRQRVFEAKPEVKVKYSLTGTLSKDRDELVDEFAKKGCIFVSPAKAEVFIANRASSSAKYQVAAKRGIPILTELEFRERYIDETF